MGAVVQRTCAAFGGGGYGGGGEVECVAFTEQPFVFSVRFAPVFELPSSAQCRIVVRLDGGASKSIPVSGTGIAAAAAVDISPRTAIDFFTVNLDKTSAANQITVRNSGSEALTLSATTALAGGVFAITGTTAQHPIATRRDRRSSRSRAPRRPPTCSTARSPSVERSGRRPTPEVSIPFTCQGVDHPIQNLDDGQVLAVVGTSRTVVVTLNNITTDPVQNLTVALQPPVLPGLAITKAPATSLGSLGTTTVELRLDAARALQGFARRVDPIDRRQASARGQHRDVACADRGCHLGRAGGREARLRSDVHRRVEDAAVHHAAGRQRCERVRGLLGDRRLGERTLHRDESSPGSCRCRHRPRVEIEVTAMPMISDGVFNGTVTVNTDSPTEATFTVPVIVEVMQGGTTVNPPLLDFREVVVTGFSETKTATFTNCTAATDRDHRRGARRR